MTKKTIPAALLIFLLFSSCIISKKAVFDPEVYPYGIDPYFKSQTDINGFFPEKVYIKTRTQTFNTYHYYILVDGLIWYKNIDPEKAPVTWRLFPRGGLPRAPWKIGFNRPERIVELSADADELVAISDQGGFYRYCFDKIIAHKSDEWIDRQGWPIEEQLFLDKRTAKNRAWAFGKRNSHVLYYEDPFGNQHHNGTLEIATIYMLLEDGQEICYSDTGLRSDFSRNYIGPERGAFKAEALSASASTMFVINDAGEMYTRLADFDTVGCDPMFFKYTYIPYKSNLPGTNYFSNLNEWGLPAEDWRAQPRIPLTGKAGISRHITILQNGLGNGARELRVAGFNENGAAGYWTKAIFDSAWTFRTAPVYLPAGSLLKNTESRGERGETLDVALSGFRWEGGGKDAGGKDAGVMYEIPNFNVLEGSCELRIIKDDEVCRLTLHPLELWTYQKRDFLPGRTGTPKIFWVTLFFEETALSELSEDFAAFVRGRFGKQNKKIFQYTLVAKNNYCFLWDSDDKNAIIFFTEKNVPNDLPDFNSLWYIDYSEEKTNYASGELTVENQVLTREELQAKIELNTALRDQLKRKIRGLEQSKLLAFGINASYLPLDGIVRLTPLRFVDVPKLRTMTRFGQKVVLHNSAYIYRFADIQGWVYQKYIDLLDARITCYTDLAKHLTGEKKAPPLPPWYSEHITPYWDIAGLPRTIRGLFFSPRLPQKKDLAATLRFTPPRTTEPVFGWYLTIGPSSSYTLFIDPRRSAETIYRRGGKTPRERAVTIDGTMYINPLAKSETEQRVIDQSLKPFLKENQGGIEIRIQFDGEFFEIREHPSSRDNKIIFRGRLSS